MIAHQQEYAWRTAERLGNTWMSQQVRKRSVSGLYRYTPNIPHL